MTENEHIETKTDLGTWSRSKKNPEGQVQVKDPTVLMQVDPDGQNDTPESHSSRI